MAALPAQPDTSENREAGHSAGHIFDGSSVVPRGVRALAPQRGFQVRKVVAFLAAFRKWTLADLGVQTLEAGEGNRARQGWVRCPVEVRRRT